MGSDKAQYDYDEKLLPAARQWSLGRMQKAISAEVSPIVIDRGNGLNPETREFAVTAVAHCYDKHRVPGFNSELDAPLAS